MASSAHFTTNTTPQSTGAPITPGSGAPDAPTDSTSSDGSVSGSDPSALSSIAGGLSSVAPYLISGGLGLFEGNNAAKQNQAKENQLSSLGTPLINQGNTLLGRANAGQLTPAEQNVVTASQQQGQTLIDKASPLYSIASSAFSQYQAGQLQPWQQQQLDASTAAAKAQLQQQFGSMGIADSSQLAVQMSAIDQQAKITKGQLMAQNLQVGDQQFAQWLTATEDGQKIQMAGKQFAVGALDNDLTQALQFSQAGNEMVQQAVTLGIQQDTALSGNIQQMMTGLMTAYARSSYNQANGKTGGGAASGIAGALGKMFGGGSSGDPAAAARASGAIGGSSITGSAMGQQNIDDAELQSGWDQQQSFVNFDTQIANQTVDPSYFNDPMFTDIPDLSFGDDGGDYG